MLLKGPSAHAQMVQMLDLGVVTFNHFLKKRWLKYEILPLVKDKLVISLSGSKASYENTYFFSSVYTLKKG